MIPFADLFYLALAIWLTMAFIKFALGFPSIGISAGVHKRKAPGNSILWYLVVVTLFVFTRALLSWPGMLKEEGWSFFGVYGKAWVIRGTLSLIHG